MMNTYGRHSVAATCIMLPVKTLATVDWIAKGGSMTATETCSPWL